MTTANEQTKTLARQLSNNLVFLHLAEGEVKYQVFNNPEAEMQVKPALQRVGASTAAKALLLATELGATFNVKLGYHSFRIMSGATLDETLEDIKPYGEMIEIKATVKVR